MKCFKDILSKPSGNQEDGNIIYFTEDEFGKLLVIDYENYRTLNFDSPFEQSCMILDQPYKLAHPYTQLMLLVLLFTQPSHVTFFGLGGGSLLRTLHHLLPDCFFKAIELRQKVANIALEYFEIPRDDQRVGIVISDALKEISNCESNSTDIIFSDMYDAYHMIPEQVQKEFLKNCSRSLTENGWLVINLHKLPKDPSRFYDLLHECFPTVIMSSNKTNTILYLSKTRPDCIRTNFETIKKAETILDQEFMPLVQILKPNNFIFK